MLEFFNTNIKKANKTYKKKGGGKKNKKTKTKKVEKKFK